METTAEDPSSANGKSLLSVLWQEPPSELGEEAEILDPGEVAGLKKAAFASSGPTLPNPESDSTVSDMF